jgi:hypothetical protein
MSEGRIIGAISSTRTVNADEKAALINQALDTLRAADALDERDDLDRANWLAWYDATIPRVRNIKVLAGAMEVELHRRRGEQILAEEERRGGDQSKVTRCVTLPRAATSQRSRDRALATQPARVAAYVQHQAATGSIPSVRGAERAVKTMRPPIERKQSQFAGRQTVVRQKTDTVLAKIDAIADGQRRTDAELIAMGFNVETFLPHVRLIPWLAIDRTVAGTTFVIDQELRAICDGRMPRPILGHQSIRAYLEELRTEIVRRRKENHDEFRKRKWNSELILKREQSALLDWIEEQLLKVPT